MPRRTPRAGPEIPAYVDQQLASVAAAHVLPIGDVRDSALAAYKAVRGNLSESEKWAVAVGAQNARSREAKLPDLPTFEAHAGDSPVEFQMENGKTIVWTPQGVSLRIEGKDGEREVDVLSGLYRPVKSAYVEGELYHVVEIAPSRLVAARGAQLFDTLKRDARILNKQTAPDVHAHLLRRFGGVPEVGYPVAAVYSDPEGYLSFCQDPLPVTPDQRRAAVEGVATALIEPLTREALQDWVDYISLHRPADALPGIGLATVSPVALALREWGIMVSHQWAYSEVPGLAKTTYFQSLAERLFGRKLQTGSAMGSEFRYPGETDAAATPVAINESHNLPWRRLADNIKNSAETSVCTRRGHTDLDSTIYRSRSVDFFTANAPPPATRSELVRFFVRYWTYWGDDEQRAARKVTADVAIGGLRPIGFAFARKLVALYPTRASLVARIAEGEKVVQGLGVPFADPRRARMWAVVGLGLELWRAVGADLGVDVLHWQSVDGSRAEPAPFGLTKEIVEATESDTFELHVSKIERLRAWFRGYLARSKVRAVRYSEREIPAVESDEIRGRGETWDEASHSFKAQDGKDRTVGGWHLTLAVLREYDQSTAIAEERFSNLPALAKASAGELGLEPGAFMEGPGKVQRFKLTRSEERQRAVFVAAEGPE